MLKYLWYAAVLLFGGLFYAAYESFLTVQIWEADKSKLILVVLGIFVYSFWKLGHLLHNGNITVKDIENGYEACDLSMAVGMLGTVVGFILMTRAFNGVEIVDVSSVKELISLAIQGMSTALYTTAAGLTSSIILRVCYFVTGRVYL